jgi:hypothetical protein
MPGGIVANPPAVDPRRNIVVGFDSGNGVLGGFRFDDDAVTPLWSVHQNHGSHMLLYPDSGEVVTADYDADRSIEQVVIRDIESGEEKARVDTASPIQSVVFPACGSRRDFYWCSMLSLSRLTIQ